MTNEIIAFITEEEKKEILKVHERRIALSELQHSLDNTMLILSLDEKREINKKIAADRIKTENMLNGKWVNLAQKYLWNYGEDWHWSLDFKTNQMTIAKA